MNPAAQSHSLSGRPVLLVDDSLMDATIAERVYERSRLSNPLKVLRSGVEFIHYMRAVEEGSAPEPALVFMDVHMEGQNGPETIRQLRSRERFRDNPRVIVLTNDDDEACRREALEAGANRFALKPAKPGEFVAFFDSFEALSDEAGARAGGSPDQATPGSR